MSDGTPIVGQFADDLETVVDRYRELTDLLGRARASLPLPITGEAG